MSQVKSFLASDLLFDLLQLFDFASKMFHRGHVPEVRSHLL